MTTWTKRTTQYSSPAINSDSEVINTITATLDGYGATPSWDNRDGENTSWKSGISPWETDYFPWLADSLPWQRGVITTNWTKR
jgi:hypothetical protein